MKETFEEFIALMKINRKNCPWVKEKDIDEYIRQLEGEVKEVAEAFEKKDYENFKEELGDVFIDFVMLMIIAEEKGMCSVKECMELGMEKIKRRKPWLLTDKTVTTEEALRIWKEVKQHEKNSRENKKHF
jgi:NTP pyrophosphatase (non-canonical NTP hydrolase)